MTDLGQRVSRLVQHPFLLCLYLLTVLALITGCAAVWVTPSPAVEGPGSGSPQPLTSPSAAAMFQTRPVETAAVGASALPTPTAAALVIGNAPLQLWADPNDINGLLHDGRYLWATTAGGVARWDPSSGDYRLFDTADGLPSKSARGIALDGEGHLWVGYADHAGWSEYDGQAWKTYATREEAVAARRDALLQAKQRDERLWSYAVSGASGNPWIWLPTVDGRVEAYDGERWRVYGQREGVTRGTWLVAVDSTSHVWAVGDGISTAEEGDRLWDDHTLSATVEENGRSTGVAIDSAGGVWVTFSSPGPMGGGVARLDAATERWTSFRHSLNRLIPPQIHGIQIDAQGTIWLSGDGGIAYRLPDQMWRSIPTAGLRVQCFVRDDAGRIWLGTDGGLWSASGEGQDLRGPWLVPGPPISGRVDGLAVEDHRLVVSTEKGTLVVDTTSGTTGVLFPDQAMALASAPGRFWISTRLGLYVSEGGANPRRVSEDPAAPLAVDGAGVLWGVLANGRLARWADGRWEARDDVVALLGAPAREMGIAQDGTMWFASGTGLGLLPPNGTFAHLTTQDGLPNVDVRALAVAEDGTLWVGTALGLVRRSVAGRWSRYTLIGTEGGLRSEEIWDLALDGQGNLWIVNEMGVSRRTPDAEWAYHDLAGLRNLCPDAQGVLWLGGLNGLYRLQPAILTAVP